MSLPPGVCHPHDTHRLPFDAIEPPQNADHCDFTAACGLLALFHVAVTIQPSRDVLSQRDGLVQREGLRVIGVLAALLIAALVMTGGLLWREHARARPQLHSVSATTR